MNTSAVSTFSHLPASLPLALVVSADWCGSLKPQNALPATSMPSSTTRQAWALRHSLGWWLMADGWNLTPEIRHAWQPVTAEAAAAGLHRLGLDPSQWQAVQVAVPWRPGAAAA